MAGDTSEGTRQLDQTPTWAVAGVCAVIIIVSIALEKVLHKLGKFFTDKHKRALFEALEKVKAELMVLGFISLILTFSQYYIAKICIPVSAADTMLPCAKKDKGEEKEGARRLLLWYEHGRSLAGAKESSCGKGKVPIITVDGLHQLHILIFFLAVLHVVYSAATMALGRLKTRGWKQWEEETSSHDYEFSNGLLLPSILQLHLAPGTKFNFQKYIKRSLEDDFQVVVGVSPVLWASFVIFLLLNVNGWQAMLWASVMPLVVLLAVGTQLQAILTKMALEITERHAVVQGIPLVLSEILEFDTNFRHSYVTNCVTVFLFLTECFPDNLLLVDLGDCFGVLLQYEYNINSCFHDNMKLVILKLVIGVGVLILCSYITLPLYALLSQMGSNMKKSIFDDQTAKAIKQWRMGVKKKHGGKDGKSRSPSVATSLAASPVHPLASTIHPTAAATLHRFKTTGHSTIPFTYEDDNVSDMEAEPLSPESSTRHLIDVRDDYHSDNEIELDQSGQARNEDDFSFAPHL
ncbi:MLO-like protein 8 [Tanacetum coccineum]